MIEIKMDGKVFKIVDNITYLGVYIDNKLNFELYLNFILKKIGKK